MIKITVAAQEEADNYPSPSVREQEASLRDDASTTQTEINGALFDVVVNESEDRLGSARRNANREARATNEVDESTISSALDISDRKYGTDTPVGKSKKSTHVKSITNGFLNGTKDIFKTALQS